jgi:hypothetical protein
MLLPVGSHDTTFPSWHNPFPWRWQLLLLRGSHKSHHFLETLGLPNAFSICTYFRFVPWTQKGESGRGAGGHAGGGGGARRALLKRIIPGFMKQTAKQVKQVKYWFEPKLVFPEHFIIGRRTLCSSGHNSSLRPQCMVKNSLINIFNKKPDRNRHAISQDTVQNTAIQTSWKRLNSQRKQK